MKFKFPSLKVRKREHSTAIFQDLLSFEWVKLRDKMVAVGVFYCPIGCQQKR